MGGYGVIIVLYFEIFSNVNAKFIYQIIFLCNNQVMSRKIVYVDMDGVLVDFKGFFANFDKNKINKFGAPALVPGVFSKMMPIKGALSAYKWLSIHFDVYILSTAPWGNPSAWLDKRLWVEKYLADLARKKLILSHRKDLLIGDYLIDDRLAHGSQNFQGKFIHFGSDKFANWASVINYLKEKENIK